MESLKRGVPRHNAPTGQVLGSDINIVMLHLLSSQICNTTERDLLNLREAGEALDDSLLVVYVLDPLAGHHGVSD